MTSQKIKFTYSHGSENYFLLFDALSTSLSFKESDFSKFVLNAVNQLTNLKIDGVLFLLPSQVADARMRIFNKDGSEAEMCGNGFRIIGRRYFQLTGRERYKIETLSGVLEGQKEPDLYKNVDSFSVLIPNVGFKYGDKLLEQKIIPQLDNHIKFSTVDVGNPQLIARVDEIDIDKLITTGEQINTKCRLFPEGNNVSFYKLLSGNELMIATYERGVGLTNSCGTAMAATAVLAVKNNEINTGNWVNIMNKGGMVKCLPKLENDIYQVKLLGNATFISEYVTDYELETGRLLNVRQVASFENEVNSYQNFKDSITK